MVRTWIRWRLRRALRWFLTLKGSPEAIALGMAIGVCVAFTPTVGFQMILGAFIATLVGASRPAAIFPAWITNPLTIPPIFAFDYWLGSFLWPGPPVSVVYRRLVTFIAGVGRLSWYEFHSQFREFLKIGVDLYVPMFIGGLIVGVICGAATYLAVLWTIRQYRGRTQRRRLGGPETTGRMPGTG